MIVLPPRFFLTCTWFLTATALFVGAMDGGY
jgi:hypothetical protein